MSPLSAEQVIEQLKLQPLPDEGGYFRQTYISASQTEIAEGGARSLATCIYYLLTEQEFSALHRLKSDEIWHFYCGDPVTMVQIQPCGQLKACIINFNIASGGRPQVLVKAGVWQGARLAAGGSWALLGMTVFPGFVFEDFELGVRSELIRAYPDHAEVIAQYTREG